MRWMAHGRLACGLLVGLAFACWPHVSRAADSERVKFETFDEVELHGTYYAGDKGNKSPCALLLHAIGSSSREEGWDNLAKELQKNHFAVLTFDFRGHGDSTSVGMRFWTLDRNNSSLKGYRPGKPKDQISYKDFTTVANYTSLVNDIAAAKRFLDRKNDSNECNSGNLVVIGAESGATLGALWIASEWKHRRPVTVFPAVAANRNAVEGQDIACAVWLSITPNIVVGNAKFTIRVDSALASPVREKVPMYFLYGDQDTKSAHYSVHLCDSVLRAGKDPKAKLSGRRELKETKLAGRELLGKSLDTEALIVKYVNKVVDDRGSNPWGKKDVEKTLLVRVPVEAFIGR